MNQIKTLAAALVVSLAPATVLAIAVSGSDPSYAITPDGRFYIVPLGDTGKVQYRKIGAVRVSRAQPVAPQAPSAPAPIAAQPPNATPAKQCTPASEWVPPAPAAAPVATTPVTRVRNRPTVLRMPGQARTTSYSAWTVTGGSQPVAPVKPAAPQLPLCPPDQDPSLAGNGGSTSGSDSPFLAVDLIPSLGVGTPGGLPGIAGGQSVNGPTGGGDGGEGEQGGESGESGLVGDGPLRTAGTFEPTTAVPEPGSLALLGLGLIGLGAARRRRPA